MTCHFRTLIFICLCLSPHLANAENWSVDETQSPMNDKKTLRVKTPSIEKYSYQTSILGFSCVNEDELELSFTFPQAIENYLSPLTYRYLTSLELRIDKKESIKTNLPVTEVGANASFVTSVMSDEFLLRFIGSKNLLVQYVTQDNVVKYLNFSLEGIDSYIPHLLSLCGYSVPEVNCIVKAGELPCQLRGKITESDWEAILPALSFAATLPSGQLVKWSSNTGRGGTVEKGWTFNRPTCESYRVKVSEGSKNNYLIMLPWCMDTGLYYDNPNDVPGPPNSLY